MPPGLKFARSSFLTQFLLVLVMGLPAAILPACFNAASIFARCSGGSFASCSAGICGIWAALAWGIPAICTDTVYSHSPVLISSTVGSAAQIGALERNARARINFTVPPIIRHYLKRAGTL